MIKVTISGHGYNFETHFVTVQTQKILILCGFAGRGYKLQKLQHFLTLYREKIFLRILLKIYSRAREEKIFVTL